MLTVDYDRLGLRRGDRVLDLGCGAGRHAYECLRRGAHVVAVDRDADELRVVADTTSAMVAAGEISGVHAHPVRADATELPFDDGAFDRVIAAEVLEHIVDDTGALDELARVLRPGGTVAVTVPSWLSETICWRLSDEYHAPAAPGGHVRIYRRSELRDKLRDAGLVPAGSHRAHALHTPYWWLRCAVGPTRDDHRLVQAYHRLLVRDIVEAPRVTRLADRLANPVLGKSVVVYGHRRRTAGGHDAAA